MGPLACPSGEIVILRPLSSQESAGEQPKPQKSRSASELEETLLPHPEELECLLCARAVSRAAPGISLCTAWAGNQLGLGASPSLCGQGCS